VNFRDTQHFLGVALRLGFFLTPIFYDPAIVPESYQSLYQFNPMTHLLEGYRSLLLEGRLPELSTLLMITVITVIMLPVSYCVFERARYRCLEQI
jgi:lipopolysaccharide transport system permease protein